MTNEDAVIYLKNLKFILKDSVLIVCINNWLKYESYNEIAEIQRSLLMNYWKDKFVKINVSNFIEFTHLKLDSMCKLKEYFDKKKIIIW